MEYIGIDVHKNQSQLCVVAEDGRVLGERRLRTERGRFSTTLGHRAAARVLIEASTESEWVARCVEELGHEVVVADPNYAPMYARRSRRVKTDRRDARALAEACRLGAYRRAHRLSPAARHLRAQLAVREALVRTRTRYIAVIRALLRRDGVRIRSGMAATFIERLAELPLLAEVEAEVAPLVAVMRHVNRQIETVEARIAHAGKQNPVMRRLRTAPGVGPVTAAVFVATLDDVGRFRRAHEVAAYLGLVPGERSSGETQHRGAITKVGNRRARWVMVQAGWGVLRERSTRSSALRGWAQRIAGRRGKRIAVVALARRLSGILYAMWRDGTDYEPARLGRRSPCSQVAA